MSQRHLEHHLEAKPHFSKKKKKKLAISQSPTLQGKPCRDSHWIFVDGTHASGHSTNFPLGEETAEVPVRAEVRVLRGRSG